MQTPIGGVINLKVNGVLHRAKGSFTYNLGVNKREGVTGADGVHGFKETPQIPSIEGAVTDSPDLDLRALLTAKEATITLELANGKVVIFEEAWCTSDGNVTTEEGEIEFSFQAMRAEEVA